VTLGTFVTALPDNIDEQIASIFAKVPQKVSLTENPCAPGLLIKIVMIVRP